MEQDNELEPSYSLNLSAAFNRREKEEKSLLALSVITPPSDNILTDIIFGGDSRRKVLRLSLSDISRSLSGSSLGRRESHD